MTEYEAKFFIALRLAGTFGTISSDFPGSSTL